MPDALVSRRVNVVLGSEWKRVALIFSALVNDRPGFPVEWLPIRIRFDEVLVDFRANRFEEIAEMAKQREIAPNGMPRLAHVIDSNETQKEPRHIKPTETGIEPDGKTDPKKSCRDDAHGPPTHGLAPKHSD
jgi:hypothetical protein